MTGQPALALRPAGDPTDRELLERFVAAREQSAFAALVQRHGAAVMGVCRRVLASEQDAEDVFQATFLTLARKAALLPWQDSVQYWLHAVARRLSLQARCSIVRRSRHLADRCPDGEWLDLPQPCAPRDDPLAEVARRELRLVLDEELGRLPQKYRDPVILCYLEGKTNEQAAGELGWPTGSMSRRLARARALLRDRLSRRGLALVVSLGCLALGCLWYLLGTRAAPEPRPSVAGMMATLGPAGMGGEGFESALLQVAEDTPGWKGDRDRLARMARQSAQVASTIQGHDPGRRREDWGRLSKQMGSSARDLAEALAHNDDRTTRTSARRLAATCQSCHSTFRD
jgi:RNA polymerase sigma-70 factor (ECF subfamily)